MSHQIPYSLSIQIDGNFKISSPKKKLSEVGSQLPGDRENSKLLHQKNEKKILRKLSYPWDLETRYAIEIFMGEEKGKSFQDIFAQCIIACYLINSF